MKTTCIGDLHGRQSWKYILQKEKNSDLFLFCGDYFDSFDIPPDVQMINFRELAQMAEKDDRIVLLLGNHDEHYILGDSGTSGYQHAAAPSIGHLLSTYKDLMKMAHAEDNILFTHAGVCETWLMNNDEHIQVDKPFTAKGIADVVNDLWTYKPLSFKYISGLGDYSGTGDSIGQTPIWIRPRSLMKDSQGMKQVGIVQVCGHTQMNEIDIKGKATGGKYYFIDTLGTSKQYLIIEDNIFTTGTV